MPDEIAGPCARDDGTRRRAILLAGIGQTWGDLSASVRRWLGGHIPSHEYDNRTTEENAVWLGAKLIEIAEQFERERDELRGENAAMRRELVYADHVANDVEGHPNADDQLGVIRDVLGTALTSGVGKPQTDVIAAAERYEDYDHQYSELDPENPWYGHYKEILLEERMKARKDMCEAVRRMRGRE